MNIIENEIIFPIYNKNPSFLYKNEYGEAFAEYYFIDNFVYDFSEFIKTEIDLSSELSVKFKSAFKIAINSNSEILQHCCDFNKYKPMNIIEFLINLILLPGNERRKNINIKFYFELFQIIYQDKYEYLAPDHYINIIALSLSSEINCCTLKLLKLLFDEKMDKFIILSNDEQKKILDTYRVDEKREYILCNFGNTIEILIKKSTSINIEILEFLLSNDTILNKFYANIANSLKKISDVKQVKLLWKIINIRKILFTSDFLFEQIRKRNYKIIKFLWSKNKKKISKLRNKNKNILEYACGIFGLVHNIVLLFWSSKYFSSMPLIRNTKSRNIVNDFIKNFKKS